MRHFPTQLCSCDSEGDRSVRCAEVSTDHLKLKKRLILTLTLRHTVPEQRVSVLTVRVEWETSQHAQEGSVWGAVCGSNAGCGDPVGALWHPAERLYAVLGPGRGKGCRRGPHPEVHL